MTETQLQAKILKELGSLPNCRLFRNNVGKAYRGKIIKRTADTITIKNPYLIKYGLSVGSGDLIGILDGKFLSVEVKGPRGRPSPDQISWCNMVNDQGGIGIITNNINDIYKL